MIIRCQKCGHENQHASIFCRKCGVKLDKEQIDTAISKQKSSDSLRRKGKIIRRFIVLAVIFFILYALFMIIYPSIFSSEIISLPKGQFSEARSKLHSFELRAQEYYTFNSPEATALYNKYFIPRKLKKSPLLITTENDNTVTFTIRNKIYDKIPITINYAISGTPILTNVKGKQVVDFKIEKIKLGNLLIPSVFGTYISKEFKPYYSRKVKSAVRKMSRIEIDKDNGFVIYLRNRKVIE